jgi:hemolysin activation/secretion protein
MHFRVSFRLASLAAALLLAEANAYADALPGSVMPEQVAKSLLPQQSLAPTGVAPQNVLQPHAQPANVSPEAQKIKFKLTGVKLIGNHVISTENLEAFYKDKINTTITVGDLFTIVQNITNYYRNSGYIISRAILPPQHVQGGMVTIQVIEGYIDKVNVSGTPNGTKCLVEGFGYRIRRCPPLNIKRLEKYMLLVNEVPNTAVKAVLSPATSSPGAADLNLETVNKRVSAYLSYDNYGTLYIGPQQMTANVAMYSAINSGDSTQLTVTKTPKGGELTFMDLNYNGPVGDTGARWILGNTRVHTHPLFVLRNTKTDGYNNNIYTSYIYPLIRNRSQALNLIGAFNYSDSNTNTILGPLYTDHIRSLDLGMTFNFADKYYGANMINVDFRKGLPLFGYTSNTNPATANTSRPGGYAAYQKFGAQLSRLQALKGNFSLLAVAKGQWAFVPLLSSEQYTFGGNPLGRAYDPAELIGDRGASGSLELRYDLGLNYFINSLQFYTFYDAGAIWNILVNSSSPRKVSATSTGLGVRFTMTKYISGNLMWTQPLTKQVAAERFIGEGWRPRTFFSVVASFD